MSSWWETAKVGDVVELPEVPIEKPEGVLGAAVCELRPGQYTIQRIGADRAADRLIWVNPGGITPDGYCAWRFRPVVKTIGVGDKVTIHPGEPMPAVEPDRWSLPEGWGELVEADCECALVDPEECGDPPQIGAPGAWLRISGSPWTGRGRADLATLNRLLKASEKLVELARYCACMEWTHPRQLAHAALAILDGTETVGSAKTAMFHVGEPFPGRLKAAQSPTDFSEKFEALKHPTVKERLAGIDKRLKALEAGDTPSPLVRAEAELRYARTHVHGEGQIAKRIDDYFEEADRCKSKDAEGGRGKTPKT